LFLDKYGSNDNHPVFIAVQTSTCVPPEITVTPDFNRISGFHCDSLGFQFEADPGMDGASPATIEGWSIVAGIGTIDNSGYYSVEPIYHTDTYRVVIQVSNSCLASDVYSFDVFLANNLPVFTNCRNNCYLGEYYAPQGYTFSLPLELSDADPCDATSMWIDEILEFGGTFTGDLYLDGSVLVIHPAEADSGINLCVNVRASDGQGGYADCSVGFDVCCLTCGELDHLGIVDIDDAVFLINYVFLSGFPPEPYLMADVDCSGGVDIDDIVHLITYVLGGGYAPCDTDGDGIPDC
jgi:hypothetical protein